MLADPKEKPARIDRKRVYTAAAALLIAGAAGQFMQKTAGGARGPAEVSASVPAISAPEVLNGPAPEGASQDLAVASEPDDVRAGPEALSPPQSVAEAGPNGRDKPAPTGDAMVADGGAFADETPENTAAQRVAVAPTANQRPAPRPPVVLETGTASTSIYPAPKADPTLEEVTRGAPDPLLTIVEPEPDHPKAELFASASDEMELPPVASMGPAEPEVAGCAIDVAGAARPGAILEIAISAPCHSGESVDFDHAGLKFSEQLGPDGSLTVDVPAMTGLATVSIEFAEGVEREVEVSVPDFDAFERIAVIWKGATGLQLHALEGGASYGEPGHLWADTPGTPDVAIAGSGGFISVLGSTASGFAADVYTYPAALMDQGVEPEVSIEAQVMENTCGGEIEGWILRTNPGNAPRVEPLNMVVPGCDSVGEYLVLKNLPVALKIARK